jgi:hypothetical protein
MNMSAATYGRGYTAPELRPDQMAVRFAGASRCVSCHANGTFSYFHERIGAWITNDCTVPQEVLDGLAADERNRVMRHMTAAGVVAA